MGLSPGLSSLLHFEVPCQDYYAPPSLLLPDVQYEIYDLDTTDVAKQIPCIISSCITYYMD
jgi:hypothetical protein